MSNDKIQMPKINPNRGQNIFIIILIVLVAILSGTTTYFASKSTQKPAAVPQAEQTKTQEQEKPQQTTTQPTSTPVAEATNRPSSPSQTYKVEQGDTLFQVGTKFNLDFLLIAGANGLKEPYKILAGESLIIPTFDETSKTTKVEFKLDEEKAKTLQQAVSQGKYSFRLDPVSTCQADVGKVYGLSNTDTFTLKSKDEQKGQATVSVTKDSQNYQIELYQPENLGSQGIWAIKSVSPTK